MSLPPGHTTTAMYDELVRSVGPPEPGIAVTPRGTKLKDLVRARVPQPLRAPLYRAFYEARRVTSPLYAGHDYFCPCCNHGFRRMRSFAGVPNCRCPHCGSLPRQRLLVLYFQQRTDLLARDHRVLHLAPEPSLGSVLSRLPNLDYTTADLNHALADLKLDATGMPFGDGEFDVFLAIHVLEHIPDDRKAMAEIFRVLRPGGWAVLQVPIDMQRAVTLEDPSVTSPEDRLRLYGQEDHVRYYGADYVDRLREAGFEVTVDSFVRELSPAVVRSYVLDDNEDIIFCRKPAH